MNTTPRQDSVESAGRRRELTICLGIATAIVLLQSFIWLRFEQLVDSDQAVYGLMAKHLSEFRTFPLFFYGQNYMLGVQAWLAVPLFWIGGPTMTMLRIPLVLLNLSVAIGFVWFFTREGLRPRFALAAALPVIALTPTKAMEFACVYGSGIEPFGYVLLLWLLRYRPLAFGAVLGFGTLHREFTFLALPALAMALWRDKALWSWPSIARRVGGFAGVWLVVDLIKRNVNSMGPGAEHWQAGSVALGAKTFLSWLSFDWPAYAARMKQIVTWGIPDLLGIHAYSLRDYSIPVTMRAGSTAAAVALSIAVTVGICRSIWLLRAGVGPLAPRWRQLAVYFTSAAVLNILIYGLNGGIEVGVPPVLRYALLAPLMLVALFGAYFALEHSTRWRAGAALALMVWAGGSVVDNVRLIRQVVHDPPPRAHRVLADYLTAKGIRYARATYWDAYIITFLSRERVIVASTTTVRISAYQEEVARHAGEAVTLRRLPCDAATKVAAWCVIGPDGK